VLPYFEASIEEIDEVMNDHNIVDIEYEFVDRRWKHFVCDVFLPFPSICLLLPMKSKSSFSTSMNL
jgi:hypothetical protein